MKKVEQADNLLLLSTTYNKGGKLNNVYKKVSRKTYIQSYKNKEIGLLKLISKLFKTLI